MAISYRGQSSQGQDDTSLRIEPVITYDYSTYDPDTGIGAVESTIYWLTPGAFNYSSSIEQDKDGGDLYSQSYFYIDPISITGSFYGRFYGEGISITGSLGVIGTSSFEGPVIVSGALRLDPTNDPGNILPSSSFLYQSASNTNLGTDLYIRQDGQYVKFNWLADQLFTGLLYGGVVTYSGNTVYISSGSGIIVDYNANSLNESAPSITYVTWPNLSFIPTYLAVKQVTYISLDSSGAVVQSYTPFTRNDYYDSIVLGAVAHFDLANVTAFQGAALTVYGQPAQINTFIDAFGPLKLSGYELTAQPSSFKLSVGSGVSFIHGGFYDYDPTRPSTINTSAQATASLAYVYQNGSGGIYFDTNGGAFYTNVTSSLYDNGTGTPASVSNNNWTIQRVYSDPRTGKLYIYYGRTVYATKADALAGLSSDTFSEGDTFDFTTFLGYLVLKSNTTNLANTTDNSILAGGLFRGISAGGGSSGGGTTSPGGSNTQIQYNNASNFGGVPVLTYDGTTLRGTGSFSGSFTGALIGTSSWASNAVTSSYVLNAISSSFASTASLAQLAQTALTASIVNITPTGSSDIFYPTTVLYPGPNKLNQVLYVTNSFYYDGNKRQFFAPTFIQTTTGVGFVGSASYAVAALSASSTATASFVATSSWADRVVSASGINATIQYNSNGVLAGSSRFTFDGTNVRINGGNLIITGSSTISGSTIITGSLQVGIPGTNAAAIDTTVGTLSRGGITSIDWVNRSLNNSAGTLTVDWEGLALADSAGGASIDWAGRFMYDSTGTNTLDWENLALYDNATFPSMDWNARYLYDSAGNRSQNYDARALIYPNGTSVALSYGTQDRIAMTGSVSITGSLTVSGSSTFTNIGPAIFSGSVNSQGGFTGSLVGTASYATTAQTLLGSVTSASFASTASFVNRLNQDVLITGSLTVGSASLGPSENTITLGARDAVNEGGQIGFNAPGGTYTSASMIDLYQNRLRILRGTNAGSDAEVAWWSMHNKQMALPAYNSATAFQGTAVASLFVDSNGQILTKATDAASTTVFVAHGNGTTAVNSLSYTCYLGGTPVSIASTTNTFGSAANQFMPGYPMAAAGTASGLIINMRTTGSATSAYRYYISNFNTSTTGSTVTMAAGHAAGVYSGSVGQVTFNQGDALFFMISSTFVAGAGPSGQLTTATFKYTTN